MKLRNLITITLLTAILGGIYITCNSQPEAPTQTDEEPFIRDEYGNMTG